jgi:hypothetical protein
MAQQFTNLCQLVLTRPVLMLWGCCNWF